MTNKYIEVVKRFMAGEVFSVEALRANAEAAGAESAAAACDVAEAARAAADAARAAEAAYDAVWFAARAAEAAVAGEVADVNYWVNEYEELTNEK